MDALNTPDNERARHELMIRWIGDSLKTKNFSVEPASNDASFRSYFRLQFDNETRIIMDAPPEHENVEPFIQVNEILRSADIHTPFLFAKNLNDGFLLLEDLGATDYLCTLSDDTANNLYNDAIDTLTKLQSIKTSRVPSYTLKLLTQEVNLFVDWFLTKNLSIQLSDSQSSALNMNFEQLVASAHSQPQTLVHRDYHSRNLMVTKENNPGVIDFQDAVVGPITYDLVSLLKDCYIKWTNEEIHLWVDYYRSNQPLVKDIPRGQFIKWFDLMGIQRHLKAIGIFARLNHRDNKPGYLKDIPRTLSYITDTAPKYKETQSLMTLIDELDIVNRVNE